MWVDDRQMGNLLLQGIVSVVSYPVAWATTSKQVSIGYHQNDQVNEISVINFTFFIAF